MAARADKLEQSLPDWMTVVSIMDSMHWTERQYWDENSPAIINRLTLYRQVVDMAQRMSESGHGSPAYSQQAPSSRGGGRTRSIPARQALFGNQVANKG